MDVAQLHYQLIRGLLERGVCPLNSEMAQILNVSSSRVEELLRDLAGTHGVVLHPHVCEPWIVHPFSLTPTINWIEGVGLSWWAPCIWCGLGVATLVGGPVRIHTRFGAEAEPLIIPVTDGRPDPSREVWVHFAIPPSRAWDNVHLHCSLVLPFHSVAEIKQWCSRHGVPFGEAVPLGQVAALARVWYRSHADREWRKWSVREAQQIFEDVGLTSNFWRLESREGEF